MATTMFMCLAICATFAYHLGIFTEENFFVDAICYILLVYYVIL